MKSFFQQSFVYTGKCVEESRTPYPRVTFGSLFRHYYDRITSFKPEIIAVASVPFALESRESLHLMRCFFTRDRFVNGCGNFMCTGWIGMDIIRKMFLHAI